MTDWRSYSVVQDKDGDLWGAPNSAALSGRWNRIGSAPLKLRAAWSDELETAYGPLTPVLDADGLPVVTTVGDLTARHVGKRVRVGLTTFEALGRILATRTLVSLRGMDTDGQWTFIEPVPLDTPVEVLP